MDVDVKPSLPTEHSPSGAPSVSKVIKDEEEEEEEEPETVGPSLALQSLGAS